MANRPLMVRAVRTIVMQMLIISLIKALEGGKRGEGVELTLIELLDKNSHVRPRLDIWGLGGGGV